jgi:acyl carrier protein phosphodiesterase
MNFLAHALLAAHQDSGDDALIAGGVAGDWIKGPLDQAGLPVALTRGVALHRAIDCFADTHPAFRTSRLRCAPERRRWSGVLVDMFYDHLLANDWDAWHAAPLDAFAARAYRALARHLGELPADARPALRLMIDERWLESYASRAGLADVLTRMSRRVRRPNPLADGMIDLEREAARLDTDFRHFMSDAVAFARAWRSAGD